MKKSIILLFAIALCCNFAVSAQKVLKYEQNFESRPSDGTYTTSGKTENDGKPGLVTDHYVSETHSMHLSPSKLDSVFLYLGKMKIEGNEFARLGFKHIAKIYADGIIPPPDGSQATYGGFVQYRKRAAGGVWGVWTLLQYDTKWGGGSTQVINGGFNTVSYPGAYPVGWGGEVPDIPTNNCWKQEYFNIQSLTDFDSLEIRFVLPQHKAGSNPYYGWLIDNIQIYMSKTELQPPTITMRSYPPAGDYPGNTERPISAEVLDGSGTNIPYLRYKYGSEDFTPPISMTEFPSGSGIFVTTLPFKGYDQLIQWQVGVTDKSPNSNLATFPGESDTYMPLTFVRSASGTGKEIKIPTDKDTLSDFPFPIAYAYAKSQYIYSAERLRQQGYRAGNISSVAFNIIERIGQSAVNKPIDLTVKMGEILPTTNITENFFTNLKTVYADLYQLPVKGWNAIEFKNTFQWNGTSDIVLQLCFTGENDLIEDDFPVEWVSTEQGKYSLTYFDGTSASPICDLKGGTIRRIDSIAHPNVKFGSILNEKLDYDAGVQSIVPITATHISAGDTSDIKVVIKNYGSKLITNLTIYYVVDPNSSTPYENSVVWSDLNGLAPGATKEITLHRGYPFTSGYKVVRAWTDSWIDDAYPDYEPLNDTAQIAFVSCDGPISGPKTIQKMGGDYPSIQGALDVMKECHVGPNGVTFTIEKGIWNEQLKFPIMPFLSSTNTVTFTVEDPQFDIVNIEHRVGADSILLDLSKSKYIIFKNINFISDALSDVTSKVISLDPETHHITFDNCSFQSNVPNEALLYSIGSENINVKNSRFLGSQKGVYLLGDDQIYSSGNRIDSCYFEGQTEKVIDAMYQKSLYIGKTRVNTIAKGPVFSIQNRPNAVSSAIRIEQNKIVAYNAANCLSIEDVYGATGVDSVIIANNMFTSIGYLMDGNAVVDIKSANNIKFIYNSLLSKSENNQSRVINVGYGESAITNSEFYNNIFSNENLGPIINLENAGSFKFNNNDYYTKGNLFGVYSSNNVNNYPTSLSTWVSFTRQDSNSLNVLPGFVSDFDLKTYNRDLLEKGKPISFIDKDNEGNDRKTDTATCIGAYEFKVLNRDLAVQDVLAPLGSCSLGMENVSILLKNVGKNDIIIPVRVYYQFAGGPVVSETLDIPIISGDTYPYTFTTQANLSVVGKQKDSVFNLKVWASLTNDLNNSNDTIRNRLIESRHQLPAPNVEPKLFTADYNASSTALPITNWKDSTTTLYWFDDAESGMPIGVGNTFSTGQLYKDTTFYISQKADSAVLRFTEIQLSSLKPGATSPDPNWLTKNTVVEISNLGNQDVQLEGYQLRLLQKGISASKNYTFTKFILRKNSVVAVQFGKAGEGEANTALTVYADLPEIAYGVDYTLGLFYKDTVAVDAIAINKGEFPSTWRVPQTMWSGVINIPSTSPGIKRLKVDANSSAGWAQGTPSNHLNIGAIEPSLIVFTDNGCYGYKTLVYVKMQGTPPTDLTISEVKIPDNASSCAMGDQDVIITLKNLSPFPSSNIPVEYTIYDGGVPGVVVKDTVKASVGSYASYDFTFSQKGSFPAITKDHNYVIKAIANYFGDSNKKNDTCFSKIIDSYRKPNQVKDTTIVINYGNNLVIDLSTPPQDMLIWYNSDTVAIDTARIFNAGYIYENKNLLVKAIASFDAPVIVGTGNATTGYTNQPGAPYYATKEKIYNKQQYLVTAAQMRAMGYAKGTINSLSFYVDALNGSVALDTFQISIGEIASSSFPVTSPSVWYENVKLVYTGKGDTIKTTGWHAHKFDTLFYWDGVNNLVVQTFRAFNTANPIAYSISNKTNDGNSRTSSFRVNDTKSGIEVPNFSITSPQMRFIFEDYHCESDYAKVTVNINPATLPAYDLAVVKILKPFANGNTPGVSDTVKIIVRNSGTQPIGKADFSWSVGNGILSNYTKIWSLGLPSLAEDTIAIGNYNLAEGTYAFTGFRTATYNMSSVVQVETPVSLLNDTVTTSAMFCMSGNYTINPAGSSVRNFINFAQAIDALTRAGVCSPVVFTVANGNTYNESLTIPAITGSSSVNTITFKTASGVSVLSSNASYVLRLNETNNIIFDGITINSTAATSDAHAVELMGKSDNNKFANCTIAFTGSPLRSIGVYINGNCTGNTFLKNDISAITGIYAHPITLNGIITGLAIDSNRINASVVAISLYNTDANIYQNKITSNEQGIIVEKSRDLNIKNNEITLLSGPSIPKKGVSISNVRTLIPEIVPSIINNMISVDGNNSIGLSIDSSSYINVYFNTVRVGNNGGATSKALYVGNNLGLIKIQDNLLTNYGGGYAYYVRKGLDKSSNYNNYYVSKSGKFAFWNTQDIPDIAILRQVSGADGDSKTIEPTFMAADNLRLRYSDLNGKGVRLGINEDIDGRKRDSKSPAIGAYEYPTCIGKDVAVVSIIKPSADTIHVDGESIAVTVKLRNLGTSVITASDNFVITAFIKGINDTVKLRYTNEFNPASDITVDLPKLYIPYKIIGPKEIVVFTNLLSDCNKDNDTLVAQFNVLPSYDIAYEYLVKADTGVCDQTAQKFRISIKNVGQREITSARTIKIGLSIPQRNDIAPYEETIHLPAGIVIRPTAVFDTTFNHTWDLYPRTTSEESLDIKAWVKMDLDTVIGNDTVKNANRLKIKSYPRPERPHLVGQSFNSSVLIKYATNTTLQAQQKDNLVIFWYSEYPLKDTIQKGTKYTTPILFEATPYYTQVTSALGCNSLADTVTVNVDNRPPYDASCLKFIQPIPRVYMGHGDTVTVSIKNYGSLEISNFPVSYRKMPSGGNPEQLVSEICTATILPGATYEYVFKELLTIPEAADKNNAMNFNLVAWTSLSNDNTWENDTTKMSFITIPESRYKDTCHASIRYLSGLDITSISYGLFHNEIPALGNTVLEFLDEPEIFYKGYEDMLNITFADEDPSRNPDDARGWIKAYIDWNRDAKFDEATELVFSQNLLSSVNGEISGKIKVPATAIDGYTRLRIILAENAKEGDINSCGEYSQGDIQDYKIYVRSPYQNNVVITKTIDPTPIVDEPNGRNKPLTVETLPKNVKIQLTNFGAQAVSNLMIHYKYNNGVVQQKPWTGYLPSMGTTTAEIGVYDFPFGATDFVAWVEQTKDVDFQWRRDTLKQKFYRYHVYEASFADNFDDETKPDNFYAPAQTTTNVNTWQKGQPDNRISNANTLPFAWATTLLGGETYPKRNQSMLYSPVFNTAYVRPDSLSFYLAAGLKEAPNKSNAFMNVQYLDYKGNWNILGEKASRWYDSAIGFTKNNTEYTEYIYSMLRINEYFGNATQLRFVFSNKDTAYQKLAEGFAIDDFELLRAKAAIDAGVIAMQSVTPEYKEYVYPTVTIKNFGNQTLDSLVVAYVPVGGTRGFIPIKEVYKGSLQPNETYTYTFKQGFLIDQTFTDDVNILAYTLVPEDYYKDNDSLMVSMKIKPLMYDLGIIPKLLKPANLILAGTEQQVSVKVRNFGVSIVRRAKIAYSIDGFDPVVEDLPIGNDGWGNGEYKDYTFNKTFHASLGNFKLKVWISLTGDQFSGNDTLNTRLVGSVGVEDLKADKITLKDDPDFTTVQFTFTNIGGVMTTNIPVAYYINGDKSTVVRETYTGKVATGAQGSHVFDTKLPKQTITSICAFTDLETDNDRSFDTTCVTEPGVLNAAAIEVLVENKSGSQDCRVGFNIKNLGNFGFNNATVTIKDLDGNTLLGPETVSYMIEPNTTFKYIFTETIPKNSNGVYNLEGTIVLFGDIDESNNTTRTVVVMPDISIDDIEELEEGFWLAQNAPNPFVNQTDVRFAIPRSGNVKFVVVDLLGRTVFENKHHYTQGENLYTLNAPNLLPGVYYYGIEFEGKRIVKKMVIRK